MPLLVQLEQDCTLQFDNKGVASPTCRSYVMRVIELGFVSGVT